MGGCLFLLGIVFIGFSILGFTGILTFAQMQLSIFILCILDVVALLVIQEKICRAYILGNYFNIKVITFSKVIEILTLLYEIITPYYKDRENQKKKYA